MILSRSILAVALLSTGVAFAQGGGGTAAGAQQGQQQAPQQPPAPLTPADKPNLSYAIGYQIGNDFQERKLDIDINTVIKAMQDGYAKRNPTVTEEQMRDLLSRMQYQLYSKAKGEFDKLAAENKAKSAKFMADNKNKKGIVSLPSGLQYRIIEDGTGTRHPTAQTEVDVHYRGSLSNGLEFDSSFARGEPAHFKVGDVIKGWQEILPLMREGDHWQVFIPPELAYGERGQPPRIGPNEALVFELKLVKVK
ncbi:MAG TPA: FKBP-type peptidyl-prolyl cis-trans isomerase [Rudaea sp.]|jgi:FKBP-type peptidyl-prolyl cis-trans isomerase FklB|nr:FKBP-type peptidyl-prolyl cis-trans isomerase [Rudaea sp.]